MDISVQTPFYFFQINSQSAPGERYFSFSFFFFLTKACVSKTLSRTTTVVLLFKSKGQYRLHRIWLPASCLMLVGQYTTNSAPAA